MSRDPNAPFSAGQRVRHITTGSAGKVLRLERDLRGEKPVPGRKYPYRVRVAFDNRVVLAVREDELCPEQ